MPEAPGAASCRLPLRPVAPHDAATLERAHRYHAELDDLAEELSQSGLDDVTFVGWALSSSAPAWVTLRPGAPGLAVSNIVGTAFLMAPPARCELPSAANPRPDAGSGCDTASQRRSARRSNPQRGCSDRITMLTATSLCSARSRLRVLPALPGRPPRSRCQRAGRTSIGCPVPGQRQTTREIRLPDSSEPAVRRCAGTAR
jgi:hypothetical protein